MIYGGLQACSLIDFPGRVSCVLFFSGCNFACPYCHNPELVRGVGPGADGLDDAAVVRFLKRRRGVLEGVVLCGGEPSLQPGLSVLCREIKSMGYEVKLDTNGGMPNVLAQLIEEKSVDYIAMDVKTDPDLYSTHIGTETGGRAVAESIPLVIGSGVEHEFRTTCVKPMVDADVIASIAGLVSGADLYILQRAKRTSALDPAFFDLKGRCFEESQLLEFKRIAENRVGKCLIR
jgi:pyruvate formate lyase activating enzyme